MKAPRRGRPSPPRLELSGSEPSHEPQSRSVKSSEKSTPRQQTSDRSGATAAEPGVPIEGMRKEFSAKASDGEVLWRGMPSEGAAVVAMEKPAKLAAIGEWAPETAATKCPSSGTAETG